ncbi:DUF1573 domain-containing protein [Psychroserpens burtonensis]|uniref:DUF1573 domain-containing protein n=2 Tax=Psychroserpens burtonensis TaxID=49278 RepID=A0A5C7B4Z1_9FLAO|nr:DUF1573 domain-containing protein [Psychroserpens burtonensis]
MNFITRKTNSLKSILNVTLVAIVLLFTSLSIAQSQTSGILTFESETIDYGTIEQHADGVRIFSFKNTGHAPIVISNVKTSCGCTVPTYPKTALLPGDSAEISIKYATNRLGKFSKTITVMSNASEGNKTLRIKGDVLKNLDDQ